MGFFDDAIGSLGKSLARSATSYLDDATGMDIGGTLSYLFSDGQTPGGATLNGLLNSPEIQGSSPPQVLLQNTLNEQSEQLGQIGTQLTSMASAISDIYGEIQGIESLLQQIQQQALYASWQVQDNFIKTYLNQIHSTFAAYASYCVPTNNAKDQDVSDLATNILESNTGELNAANGINSYMVDDQSNKGALTLWVNMVSPLILAGLLDYRQAVDQFKDYYTKLTWAQLRATNLVIEAYNFKGDNALAASAWSTYKALIISQESSFISNLVLLVSAGLKYYNPSLSWHAGSQFYPDSISLYTQNGTFISAYYAVSPIFSEAEAFLSRLALTDPDDRRIVVHMTYAAYTKTAIDSSTITITQTDSTADAPLSPSDESAAFGPFPTAYNGQTVWVSDTQFYVSRLVYLDSVNAPLNDGTYALTDLNGQGALVPMQMYSNPSLTAFQSDPVLGYVMRIDATQPFDFMNFAAYFGNDTGGGN
ncbi:MAG: hypothetical protein ACMG51_10455 [Ginsengibacter sp.]